VRRSFIGSAPRLSAQYLGDRFLGKRPHDLISGGVRVQGLLRLAPALHSLKGAAAAARAR